MLKAVWKTLAKKTKGEQGFTLVELLVVIAILGVLTGIAVPTYTGFQERAKEAATLAELQAVRMAWQYYDIEHDNLADGDSAGVLVRYLGDDLLEADDDAATGNNLAASDDFEVGDWVFMETYVLSDVAGDTITATTANNDRRTNALITKTDIEW